MASGSTVQPISSNSSIMIPPGPEFAVRSYQAREASVLRVKVTPEDA